MHLAQAIKQFQEKTGMNLKQLSRETEIPYSTLQNWTAQANPKSLSQVKRLADFMQIPMQELLFKKEKKNDDEKRKKSKGYRLMGTIEINIDEIISGEKDLSSVKIKLK